MIMLRSVLLVNSVVKEKFFSYMSAEATFISSQLRTRRKHSNVDQQDVAHHSSMRNGWWDPQGPVQPLHAFNEIRVPFIKDGLSKSGQKHSGNIGGLKVLDVACGGGILSEPIARLGAQVTGIDASEDLIELAKEHSSLDRRLKENLPKYICTTIEEHAETYENHYDGVVASEIIEHVDNKHLFVESCVKLLKPGGTIFFTTPTRTRLGQFFIIFVAEYLLNMIPRGTHQYEKFITPEELKSMLNKLNCESQRTEGVFFNVVTKKWQVLHSKSFVFMLQATKLK